MIHPQGTILWSLNSEKVRLEVLERDILEIRLSERHLSPFLSEGLQVCLEVDFTLDNEGTEFLQVIPIERV